MTLDFRPSSLILTKLQKVQNGQNDLQNKARPDMFLGNSNCSQFNEDSGRSENPCINVTQLQIIRNLTYYH